MRASPSLMRIYVLLYLRPVFRVLKILMNMTWNCTGQFCLLLSGSMSKVLKCVVIDCDRIDERQYREILSNVSKERGSRAESFKSFSDKVMSAVAGLCMEGLASSLGTKVRRLENGKPVFVPVDMAAASKALDMLAKHTGAYEKDNKREHSGKVTFGWLEDEE